MTGSQTVISRRARQASHSVRRFFDAGNLFRFLVSIVLAFGLWALVTYQNDPETTRVMGGMTVTIANLDTNLELVGDPPAVDITIQGPQSIVTPLERDNVTAIADMDGLDTPGSYEVEIEIDAPSDVRVRDIVPDTVALEIDTISERSDIPIVVNEPADVPPDFEVATIQTRPETLSIAGPVQIIDAVEEAHIEIQIDGRTGTFTENVQPVLVDASGDPIVGLTPQPENVTITITLDVAKKWQTMTDTGAI
jgi:YbbR domain-containing protein